MSVTQLSLSGEGAGTGPALPATIWESKNTLSAQPGSPTQPSMLHQALSGAHHTLLHSSCPSADSLACSVICKRVTANLVCSVTCKWVTKPLTWSPGQPDPLHMTAWHPTSQAWQASLPQAPWIASRERGQIADGFSYLHNNLIMLAMTPLTCSTPPPVPCCKVSKLLLPKGSPCDQPGSVWSGVRTQATLTQLELHNRNRARQIWAVQAKRKSACTAGGLWPWKSRILHKCPVPLLSSPANVGELAWQLGKHLKSGCPK